jgi:hypothetical protein
MGLSSYFIDKFLNHHFKGTNAGTAPTTLYASIHSADPALTGANEVTGTYFSSRASYTSSNFSTPATVGNNRRIVSTASLNFGTSIAAGSNLPFFGFWDASTSGNFLGGFPFRNALGVTELLSFGSGDSVSRASGNIVIDLDILFWSIYARDLQLNWLKGSSAGTAPTSNQLALATAIATNGTITEITATVATGGRFSIPSSGWSAISTVGNTRQIQVINNINYGNAIAAATGFNSVALFDSTNLIVFSSVSTQNITVGQELIIPAGNFKVSLGNV